LILYTTNIIVIFLEFTKKKKLKIMIYFIKNIKKKKNLITKKSKKKI